MRLAVPRFPQRIGWRDHLVGASLGLAYVVALLATAPSIGFMRDESFYFRAATDYFGWWKLLFERGSDAFAQSTIDRFWSYNHEHPALVKTLFGFSWGFLYERWHLFKDASAAYRFPAMCLAGGTLWTTFLFGARVWGSRLAGLASALLLALMPRVFFHAHLACFDIPIMSMWLFSVYVYWRAETTHRLLWAIAAGLVFGLTLETKHNAWELPAVFVPHALFLHWRTLVRGLRVGRLSLPASLVSMAVLGPLVFYALWPYIWNDTVNRVLWYVNFHLHHDFYSIEFLGRNYGSPPSPKAFLPVMVIATVPTVTIVLFLLGFADRAIEGGRRMRAWLFERIGAASPSAERRLGDGGKDARNLGDGGEAAHRLGNRGEIDLLLALSLIVPTIPFFFERTPVFGATKHWLPAYPFLALFAGRGFQLAAAALRRALPAFDNAGQGPELALLASVTLAPLAVTAHACPYGLSSYVPIVGGTAGGADLGLNRQFWGFTTQNAASEYLNPDAPRNATVFIHDTTYDAWRHMQEEGRVRADLRAVGTPNESQIALLQHELHMNEVDHAIWVAFGRDAPAYVVTHDGVPIVSVYRR